MGSQGLILEALRPALELQRLTMESWRLTLELWRLLMMLILSTIVEELGSGH